MQKRLSALTALCLTLIFTLLAAPYYGEEFHLAQPDGSNVPVLVWGDEFFQRVESPDGFTLIRDSISGWICYAEVSTDSSELVSTGIKYQPAKGLQKATASASGNRSQHLRISRSARLARHRTVRRQLLGEETDPDASPLLPAPSSGTASAPPATSSLQRNHPVTGELTGLTICIDFSDQPSSVPLDSIKDFVNKRDYTGFRNNGSVRDFFFDVSGGKVDYQNIVVGYYRAKNPKTYYDASNVNFGSRAQELINEALSWLKNDGFDFSGLSVTTSTSSWTGTRKTIQAINVLYAGSPTQGWSQGLWPHQGRMNNVLITTDIYASVYQMSNIGTSLKIGTFCHENGHMLFSWPDLYDYGGESSGVGVFCIMCNTGTTNPIGPCAYLRDYSGWDAVTDITDITAGTVFTQLPTDMNTSFVFRNKSNDRERYYIESRRRVGRFKTLPDSGFMIWHVDQDGSNDNQQRTATSHYLVSLIQADNAFHLENNLNSGRAGDLFRGGYKDRFDDNTGPNAHWWNGSNSGLKVYNMSDVADTMSFSVGETTGPLFTVVASAGEHGVLNPSGKISVPSGASLSFFITPDSGYQVDAITIDSAASALVDTIRLNNITAAHTVKVLFGLKGALRVVTPEAGTELYANDATTISWRSQGVTLQGIDASFSSDGGKTFTPVRSGISAADSQLTWPVPLVESDSCIVRLADTDGNPTALSGMFSIRKKPSITLAGNQITLSILQGTTAPQALTLNNTGTGDLVLSATTRNLIEKIVINELWLGADAVTPDAIEIYNEGADMDLSGWQLVWDDNKSTSGSFTFPDGFILEKGATYSLVDQQSDSTPTSEFMGLNVMWQFDATLEVAVTLLDATGRGVDFVKSSGIPILPPEGTTWKGEGIPLCDASIQRNGLVDLDSAVDWICSATGSPRERNATQPATTPPPLITTQVQKVTTPGGTAGQITFTLDATTVEPGTYKDTLVIYHNDPDKPSPLLIPCQITVTTPIAVVAEQRRFERPLTEPRFSVSPNPVHSGEKCTFAYLPAGDETRGTVLIYNRVGDCLYSHPVDFSRVSALNRKILRFSWQPRSRTGGALPMGTLVARLVVQHAGGSRKVHSAMLGIR